MAIKLEEDFLQNYGGHQCVATIQRTAILRPVLSKDIYRTSN